MTVGCSCSSPPSCARAASGPPARCESSACCRHSKYRQSKYRQSRHGLYYLLTILGSSACCSSARTRRSCRPRSWDSSTRCESMPRSSASPYLLTVAVHLLWPTTTASLYYTLQPTLYSCSLHFTWLQPPLHYGCRCVVLSEGAALVDKAKEKVAWQLSSAIVSAPIGGLLEPTPSGWTVHEDRDHEASGSLSASGRRSSNATPGPRPNTWGCSLGHLRLQPWTPEVAASATCMCVQPHAPCMRRHNPWHPWLQAG